MGPAERWERQKRRLILARNSATLQHMRRLPWTAGLAALLIVATLAPARAARTIAFDSGALTAEKLVQLCLARIQANDRQGPSLHAVMTLNPKALDTARALDAERKSKGP